MSTQPRDITRVLGIDWLGHEPVDGFTLQKDDDGLWEVSDGREARTFAVGREADALRTYAEFIATFVDDQDDETKAEWQRQIAQAREDAAAIDGTTGLSKTRAEAIVREIVEPLEGSGRAKDARAEYDVDTIAAELLTEDDAGGYKLAPRYDEDALSFARPFDAGAVAAANKAYWDVVHDNAL